MKNQAQEASAASPCAGREGFGMDRTREHFGTAFGVWGIQAESLNADPIPVDHKR